MLHFCVFLLSPHVVSLCVLSMCALGRTELHRLHLGSCDQEEWRELRMEEVSTFQTFVQFLSYRAALGGFWNSFFYSSWPSLVHCWFYSVHILETYPSEQSDMYQNRHMCALPSPGTNQRVYAVLFPHVASVCVGAFLLSSCGASIQHHSVQFFLGS